MNTAEKTSIQFANQAINDRFHSELGGLSETIIRLSNDHARNTIGENYIANPSVIELTSHVRTSDDQNNLSVDHIVTAWHETTTPGKVGILQRHNTIVTSVLHGEDGYLRDKDMKANYLLTTREALLLEAIAGTAIIHSAFSQTNRDR
ncbi:MAG: hypothetical protein ABIR91_01955 [Candidatus Saccharimonadales bacterium]